MELERILNDSEVKRLRKTFKISKWYVVSVSQLLKSYSLPIRTDLHKFNSGIWLKYPFSQEEFENDWSQKLMIWVIKLNYIFFLDFLIEVMNSDIGGQGDLPNRSPSTMASGCEQAPSALRGLSKGILEADPSSSSTDPSDMPSHKTPKPPALKTPEVFAATGASNRRVAAGSNGPPLTMQGANHRDRRNVVCTVDEVNKGPQKRKKLGSESEDQDDDEAEYDQEAEQDDDFEDLPLTQ